MKQFLAVLIALALLVGMSVLAVDRFHDRTLFVSPPDAVAESFTRSVVCGRYEQARTFLQDPSSMSEGDLRALDATLGKTSNVEAKVLSRDDERAVASVRVGSHTMSFAMVFDREWKVIWSAEATPPLSNSHD